MIHLTKLNYQPFTINSDLITVIENTPDTVITLLNGDKIVVRESNDQVLERIVEFRRRILDGLPTACLGKVSSSGADVKANGKQSSGEETC